MGKARIESTKDIAVKGRHFIIYGQSGAGKTSLIRTLPEEGTLILDTEAGLLPLAGKNFAVIRIHNLDDFKDAYSYIKENASTIKNLVFDSLTELAKVVLADAKANVKDGRQAYGTMGDTIDGVIRNLLDMDDMNLFCICQQDKVQDDTGRIFYGPALPGQKATQSLPYPFDEVMVIRVDYDQDGKPIRHLQTSGDDRFIAKDRSGKLDFAEEPDLSAILKKIQG